MKRILLPLILVMSCIAHAQPYNNEWIDYSKTYYKFKVGVTGIYRISQPTLATIGLGSTPAEHFKLWRNGQEVPLFTSAASGPLGAGGYIEFWGERNDGRPDKELYRDPDHQLIDKYSFQTDTAAFFLTVHTEGANLRMDAAVNNVAGNVLPAEPYFMYTEGKYYNDQINQGFFIDAGEHVYSSTYDRGENWACWDIWAGQSLTGSHTLYLYNSGPTATFKVNLSGNAINPRRFRVKINADSVYGQQMDYLNYTRAEVPNIPLSLLSSGSANIEITNQSTFQYDRMVISQYELIYPRVFNFASQKNFEFELPANAAGNYLEISNFNYGSMAPVLYDVTNRKRYVADISDPALVKFALLPSAVNRKLILISLDASNIASVSSFITRNFFNVTASANHGDYLIISHSSLFTGTNPVEQYRAYRSSAAGGNFNAKVYDIDELVDQFAFGIKKHPASIRNFMRWARTNFTTAPKFLFLIGHGVKYDSYRVAESYPDIEKLNLVPTFGAPASDILLTADPGGQIQLTPVGRLSVVNTAEISAYLTKVQQYESAQQLSSPLIQDKAWMKNMMHVVGAGDPILQAQLNTYMNKYKQIITDTLFGARVTTFSKTSAEAVQQFTDQAIKDLFAEGLSQIAYFGHSSASVLDFNLGNPEQYSNQGKYPVFIAMGCSAGSFFGYNPGRLYVKETISEKFVLADQRGSIAFIASTHFGIPHYLDLYNTQTYTAEGRTHYGKTLGEIMKHSVTQVYAVTSFNDFFARFHTEQTTLHGDPAIKPNSHAKPDYVIEDKHVKITPSFISIAETNFKVDATFLNIGRAVNQDIAIEVKRQFPNGNTVTVYKDTIPGLRYSDSLTLVLPINPTTDKGLNRIIVTIDADGVVDELYETNNSVTKDVFIFEDEARPVYPLNYAIINKQNIKLLASTANPFSISRPYRMEIDTAEFFNSPFKFTQNITSAGGLLEFTPGITFTDSTVYYWRISPLDSSNNPSKWNHSSFVYLPASDLGFNQSHFFQHTKSSPQRIFIDSATRTWKYIPVLNNLLVRTGIYPTASTELADFTMAVNGESTIGPGCAYNELIINVFDSVTFQPWLNSTGNLYNSNPPNCSPIREWGFYYYLYDTLWRRRAQNFLENVVPDGAYVVIRSNTSPNYSGNTYAAAWRADTAFFGSGNSLYHTLKNQGFSNIDLYDTTRCFGFVYKKNRQSSFTPVSLFSDGIYDKLLFSVDCPTPDTLGYITSPVFGPAKQWKDLKWRGAATDMTAGDNPTVDIIGVDGSGMETTLLSGLNLGQQDFNLSFINPVTHPFVKLRMRNVDSINQTAYQLRYWRITYTPVPEGALAPNILLQMKDSLEEGEPLDFKIAFKNISESNFDSLKVKMIVTDKNNVANVIPLSKFKPLISGDTLHVRHFFNTAPLSGLNTLYVDVNPDNDQPEQFHFNNFLYKNFFVNIDKINPLLDVTFDGIHILNRDIVSSKPRILIKLKDESKWLILNDTSGISVQVRFPNGTLHPYYFANTDTLKFTAAGSAPNPDNTASIDFLPYFPLDGEYELIVSGKDRSGNTAGNVEYKVGFQVINKPMISNMLNYPNPFTTSTAFVFTITGSEVPQNIKIQIMTITGKIVREITKDELGPLHIGRNITEFKWDGTDQYGQRLANGIYLYRVVTNLNGKSLDKYKAEDDNTDKYFNKGYGKMYLMR
jgi:hypothetical protein